MSYSNPVTTRIQSGAAQDMGNGTPTVFSFKGPTGMKGTIIDVGIEVTETFACDSTEASFQVGTTGDANAYCQLNVTDGTALTDTFNIQNDTNAIIAEAIPADTQIECTPVVGVDSGTEAGIGYPYVVVEWY
jgi:hypothetical protein